MNLGFHTTTTDVTNENWTFPSPAFKWIFDSDDGLFGLCRLHKKNFCDPNLSRHQQQKQAFKIFIASRKIPEIAAEARPVQS